MKNLLTKLLCFLLLPCLLLCGCEKETEKETVTVCTLRGGAYVTKSVEVDKITETEVLRQLTLENLASEACAVKALTVSTIGGQKSLRVDMNEAFLDLLESRNSEGQQQTVRCVANTFLLTYDASFVTLTVNGEPLTTKANDFSEAFALEGLNATPSPTATSNAGAETTATATASPTPAPTPYREPGKKYVALTFDDGPGSYTKDIADLLKSYNANATFFIVGDRVTGSWKTGLQYAYEQGFEIAIHAYTHKSGLNYKTCDAATYQYELGETDKVIKELTGQSPTMMRPVGGSISQERIASCPYAVIHWQVDSEDWRYKSKAQSEATELIVNNIMKTVKDGDIILMHEIYKTSYEALKVVLARLTEEGYSVVSVSELIGLNNLKPGKIYHHN